MSVSSFYITRCVILPYRLVVTKNHILEGDHDKPYLHPIALAAKVLFPKDELAVSYGFGVGWVLYVGQLVAKLSIPLAHLCDDLSHLDVDWSWWSIGGVDDKTWREWIWECWRDEKIVQYFPHLDEWAVECLECHGIYEQIEMEGIVCTLCADRSR